MAEKNKLQQLNIGGKIFDMSAWGHFGITEEYFLALLSRDEYTPVAEKQPTETDTTYIDPGSGNPAGFHSGQCVLYPDSSMRGGYGLSIAMMVEYGENGVPKLVYWLHLTENLQYLNNDLPLEIKKRFATKDVATQQADGLMSAEDKTKLDELTPISSEDMDVLLKKYGF